MTRGFIYKESKDRYLGARPFRDLYVSIRILKSAQNRTGSQFKEFQVGVKFFLVPVRILAAEFCKYCNLLSVVLGTPTRSTLQ